MAQYFFPSRQNTVHRAELEEGPSASGSNALQTQSQLHLDIDRSIYIFPSPASSVSAPTDYAFSSVSDVRPRPGSNRTRGNSEASWVSSELTGGELSERSPVRSLAEDTNGSNGVDSEVEVWELTGDEGEGDTTASTDGVNTALEGAVERAGRWELLRSMEYRSQQQLESFPPGYWEHHLRLRRRLRQLENQSWDDDSDAPTRPRTLSNLSGKSSSSSRPPVLRRSLRIPFLSMFASILKLDDSTLHLLTHSSVSHSSPLFAGPQLFVADVDEEAMQDDFRGLTALSDGEAQKALQRGVRYACDEFSLSNNPFAIELPFLSFLKLVNGVWNPRELLSWRSSQPHREVEA